MQEKQTSTALVWFRNDLRTRDQHSLYRASSNHEKVVAIYYLDPRHFEMDAYGFRRTAVFRAKFLLETLVDLKAQLFNLNISLFVVREKPEDHLPQFVQEHNISDIYYQEEWTTYEREVESELKTLIKVSWHAVYDQFLYHPDDVPYEIQKIPEVFTLFRKRVEKESRIRDEVFADPLDPLNRRKDVPGIPSLADLGFIDPVIPAHTAFPFEGGESSGLKRIEEYMFESRRLAFYKKTRNGLLGKDYSSKFSSWLANGSLSARTIYWAVKRFEKSYKKNQSTYWMIFELIWRDYFKYISLKHGDAIFYLGGIKNRSYNWNSDYKRVMRWINGETDSDFVNANMIELKQSGWMSNRGRQNVASYLARDMEIDWRIGAAYFESMLIDYDVHSNYGNWMYVSGVGNDPRDRKFNVQLQAQRYDSDGRFRKRWLQTDLFS